VLDQPRHTKRELRKAPEPELRRLWRTVPAALEVLVERYQALVRSIAGKFRPQPHDFEDYAQAGNLGLLAAIKECDPTRTLSSYVRVAIYRAIRDHKNETDGPVYRPVDSENSFKYRWATPGAKAMLLASEANCFTDPLSVNFRSEPDWSFDYQYESEDEHDEGGDLYDRFTPDIQTFDRRGHEERIKLDHLLKTLDSRARHIIEERWVRNE
jgi:RNA polymerase sigma factor (sigma-70 family)